MTTRTDPPEEPTIEDLYEQLDELEDAVDTKEELKEVNDVRRTLERLPGGDVVKERISRYTTRDVAESFVGSILISLPLLVEDGVNDIADHFLANTLAGVPVWLVTNTAFMVVMTWGLLYWAEFRHVADSNPLLGFIPRRLVGVLVISLVTVVLTMTMWGRVDGWADPATALARVSVVWTAAAFGGALGDILPGESEGVELGDVPQEVGESVRSDD